MKCLARTDVRIHNKGKKGSQQKKEKEKKFCKLISRGRQSAKIAINDV